jgi:S1-C subfamily serine protease
MFVIALLLNQSSYAQRPADPPDLRLFDRLVLRGPGSQIGATARDLKPSERESQNWLHAILPKERPSGVIIEEVRSNSPASRAGLKKGDIIIEFDGYTVRNIFEFTRLVEETPPGLTVKTVIVRSGRTREIAITPTH